MKSSTPDPHSAPSPRLEPPSPHRRERHALRTGLAVSLVLHLVAVALYPLLMDNLVPVPQPADPAEEVTVRPGMEVLLLQEVAEVAQPEPVAVEVQPDLPVPTVDPTVPEEDEAVAPPPEYRRSVAERLRPRLGDPRLWVPMDRDAADLTDHERAELLLRGMIQDWNDSMAVAAALAADATDWTYTDDEGRRWGLSPGRLHLGDFSIPLPFGFQASQGLREQWMIREWQDQDLARAARANAIRETWAERAREIRRRMEAERGGDRS